MVAAATRAPRGLALAALLIGASGCGAPAGSTPRARPTSGPGPGASAAASALPAPRPGRVALGEPEKIPLPIALVPITGADAVLAVHDHAGAAAAYAQRVAEDGTLGPVLVLPGAHVAGAQVAAGGGADLALLTTEDDRVCAWTLRGAERLTHGCDEAPADLAVPIADKWLILDAHVPEADEEGDVEAARKKPAKKRAAPAPARRRAKPRREPSAVEKLFASGRELAVSRRWLGLGGAGSTEAEPTGLRFTEPMAGLGLIGAGPRGERVDVAFYDRAAPRGKDGRGSLGVATLDLAGTLVEGSRRTFGESKLAAGFLVDHVDARLVSTGGSTLLVSHRGGRGACDATVVAPFVMQMVPDATDCAADPARFFELAQQRRKKVKPPPPEPARLPEGVSPEGLRRVTGQAPWDAVRVAATRARTFALVDGGVISWSRGGAPTAPAPALVAERLRVFGAAVEVDGSAIAHTSRGLVVVSPERAVTRIEGAEPRLVGREDRPDVSGLERRLAVKVGGAWLQATGELRRLAPEPGVAQRRIAADTAVVVGGRDRGLLLELFGARMEVSALDAGGASTVLGSFPSPVGVGFDAVRRADGGAIVAGPARSGSGWISFAVGADGAPLAVHAHAARPERGEGVVLSALPGGGAIASDRARRHVVWLADDASALAAAPWPMDASAAACLDGAPARISVPGAEPGKLVPLRAARDAGTCVVHLGHAIDGSIRWVGSAASTIHIRAELGVEEGAPRSARAAAPAPSARLGASNASRCPSDMVAVGEDLCVDRFEGTLTDQATGRYFSPDYPPTQAALKGVLGDWVTRRERQGDLFARALPLPAVEAWQHSASPAPVALSRSGVRPSGYVTGAIARGACEVAGKRLCRLDEWRRACKGAGATLYPYGASYEDRACNVNGFVHPAAELHGNASLGHLDPRLNRVSVGGHTLLAPTGSSPRCRSRWGEDAIFDMVGNLDEWVDEKGGAFAGGFYARATTSGCEAVVTSHPETYLDYSTGFRCCKTASR